MRVLDFDMDFFLNKIAWLKPFDGKRLSDDEYLPWNEEKVVGFFETNCGLRKDIRVKGQIFDEHVEAFSYLKNKIHTEQLTIPFEIVHIDAHADLGLGDASWSYIFENFLSKSIFERENIDQYNSTINEFYQLGSSNYLLYVIACEWLSKLTYVTHPHSKRDDYNINIMKDFNEESGFIQLKYFPESVDLGMNLSSKKYNAQPEVIFEIVDNCYKYQSLEKFDYVLFSKSLSYTPATADFIVDVIMRYIDITA